MVSVLACFAGPLLRTVPPNNDLVVLDWDKNQARLEDPPRARGLPKRRCSGDRQDHRDEVLAVLDLDGLDDRGHRRLHDLGVRIADDHVAVALVAVGLRRAARRQLATRRRAGRRARSRCSTPATPTTRPRPTPRRNAQPTAYLRSNGPSNASSTTARAHARYMSASWAIAVQRARCSRPGGRAAISPIASEPSSRRNHSMCVMPVSRPSASTALTPSARASA